MQTSTKKSGQINVTYGSFEQDSINTH
jgi:hypothetical protein